jgi:hypothetical protein
MTVRKDFEQLPPEAIRLMWCDWLTHHTIDPDTVAIPGFIEIDHDAYRIAYLAFDLNENGRPFLDASRKDAQKSVRVVQLEARPSDFPQPTDGRWRIRTRDTG